MTRAGTAIALLLSPFALIAQNGSASAAASFGVAGPENGQFTLVAPQPGSIAACPIGMQANQGVWNHRITIRNGDKDRVLQPFGQKISLTLKDPRHARITAATVRVHGLTGKNRIMQAGNQAAASDAARTIHLSFGTQSESGVTGTLWIPGFTAISFIELQEVSYADGSAWRTSVTRLCRVQPDPLMLVSDR